MAPAGHEQGPPPGGLAGGEEESNGASVPLGPEVPGQTGGPGELWQVRGLGGRQAVDPRSSGHLPATDADPQPTCSLVFARNFPPPALGSYNHSMSPISPQLLPGGNPGSLAKAHFLSSP